MRAASFCPFTLHMSYHYSLFALPLWLFREGDFGAFDLVWFASAAYMIVYGM